MKIEIGLKEITALSVAIPLVYDRVRKLKQKYDKESAKRKKAEPVVFEDIFVDAEGNTWRREK